MNTGFGRWIASFDELLRRLEYGFMGLSSLAILAIMTIVVVDVFMRYALHSPLSWSYDLISMYLIVILIYFAMSDALRERAHVALDIFNNLGSRRQRAFIDLICYLLALAFFGAMAWLVTDEGIRGFVKKHATSGAIAWPTWIPQLLAGVGLWLMDLRLLHRILVSCADFAETSKADPASGQASPP